MAISVLNTDAGLSGKTLINVEDGQTVTGLKTFDRDPSPPFAVSSGSAVVSNLDADKLDGLEATDFVKKDGTVAMTAKLDLGTNGQIQFPASQNASTNANTLDDYEEGTWTPTPNANLTITSGTAVGSYVKIGKLVHIQWGGTVDTVSGVDEVSFTLPFTAYTFPANSDARALFVIYTESVNIGDAGVAAWVASGGTAIGLKAVNDNGTTNAVGNNDLAGGDKIFISGSYIAAA